MYINRSFSCTQHYFTHCTHTANDIQYSAMSVCSHWTLAHKLIIHYILYTTSILEYRYHALEEHQFQCFALQSHEAYKHATCFTLVRLCTISFPICPHAHATGLKSLLRLQACHLQTSTACKGSCLAYNTVQKSLDMH